MALIQPTRHGQPFKPQVGKRLLLVDPYPRNNRYHLTASERRAVWFPKLSLPTIAAYTPESWDVDLVDEAVEDIDFDTPCDMVGLDHDLLCAAGYEIAQSSEGGQNCGHGRRASDLLSGRSSLARCDCLRRGRRLVASIGGGL